MRSCPVLTLLCAALAAQQPTVPSGPLLPGAVHDAAVPTPAQVLGYEPGAEISLHAEVESYLRALAAASPKVRLFEYGRSWQGRRLWYAVVANATNMARLETIQQGMARLADPRVLAAADAERLIADLPAVAWLAYCVHGDEPSGSDAALALLHHLVAARGDATVDRVLDQCVVIVDPLQNPDGRDRFAHGTRAARGRWAMPDPDSAEHTQPWPGGRPNHYLFDMNRDWFAMSQPETQARVRAFLQWWPLCYVDLHEMGGNSTYYFAPPAQPLNPEITQSQRDWLMLYGRNNAAWFDRFGIDYFTREEFDSFYPGYGEGWPTFQGCIGMTFEQGSSRGLLYRRRDDSLLSYHECVRNHLVASLGTLDTISKGRREALQAFFDYRRTAIDEGRNGPVREYVFPDRGDRTRLARLMNLLLAQGIEVHRAQGALQNGTARPYLGGDAVAPTFPAGTYVVALSQPQKRLATVLLHRHFDMDPAFLAEQQKKEHKRQDLEFYDLTGWSLPLLFDVETWIAPAPSVGELRLLRAGEAAPTVAALEPKSPQVGWVVAWGKNGAAALLAELLGAGIKARCMDKPFKIGGRDFPAGSFVVKAAGHPAELPATIARAALVHGVEVLPTDSSWVDEGIHFGSNNTHMLRRPEVAIAWDRPAGANSTGWARYLLEQRYGVPVTPVRTHQLAQVDLDRYTVLVLPDGGGFGAVIGKSGAAKIKQWVERGGVLVTLGGATRWLTDDGVGLLATQAEDRQKPKDKKGKDEGAEGGERPTNPDARKPDASAGDAKAAASEPLAVTPGALQDPAPRARPEAHDHDHEDEFQYDRAVLPDKEPPPRTPGAILRVRLDPEHWLAFGYAGFANVVSESSDIWTPIKLDKGSNVGVYETVDKLVLAGFTWEAAKKQLAQKAWLVHQPHGKGHVVAFAEDPNVRGFADGLNLLFLNAVLLTAGR
ncbi:MAG: peptidase M14 [Planctomycetes bacterium]|nr:peptidase M14 [Planctomycetota bacterium]